MFKVKDKYIDPKDKSGYIHFAGKRGVELNWSWNDWVLFINVFKIENLWGIRILCLTIYWSVRYKYTVGDE